MSKKSKQSKPVKSAREYAHESEPLRVNWFVIAGAIAVVGALAFFSIQQSQQSAPAATGVASSGGDDCAPTTKQWSAPPEMMIDTSKQYTATVTLAKGGQFTIQLFPDKAPITVNSFVFLAREGFFDCVTFHRVLEGFMAQGGDPTGTGAGGPGYEFVNEDSDLKFDKAGVVAMANAGRDTNGSQFFITFAAAEHLNGGYTIFGQVTDGMDVVNSITLRDPNTGPTFSGDVIQSVAITEQ
ncbi:MAG: peptidylprolyl isomerase [Chloroflexi bacterium]|nr:peptidylprolyl isomerase [Chloroflexota bacterium]